MKITLTAPEGYVYLDKLTNRTYKTVVVDNKDKKRFELVVKKED